ncbi:1-acylglycerol-3-phosphate O-acyltransferase [Candidatus Purcelliella pentastirinorum]|uniref:1-acyl-sn-glycerol-3-phosphate acyltransferase n=1 Tax=Candidatus Purcelliella pentastirinorum TaxID=472834 RepID=A0AAX3N7G1_9ENTR|nr:1-acylglycerol-3-phosphate O-acyltransferase [Candidatus Purcelliella pentastirinorum]WDI78541.1 1-acylglycerol-3-phosphate O-acyltransferase [Candidatus Purcelliella pentastirinorum]WDR80430.1 1-acylglycerol-3-phosphate O-acyltransferase [Candidatus Purcelliella pentastirinorum]
MLLILRVIFLLFFSFFFIFLGIIYCLFHPRSPRNLFKFSFIICKLNRFLGITLEVRRPINIKYRSNVIYISNHQNNYDLIAAAGILQDFTVTVGKRSILLIPFFGLFYWLSGNFLIERFKFIKAYNTLLRIINVLKNKKISIWMFPEGTRSNGRGILSFKTGAFYMAISAKIPIIPIVISNIHNKVNLNRFNNGLVIVEMLSPIEVHDFIDMSARELAIYCNKLIKDKFIKLNNEIYLREN